mmetsp:Transcript_59965/g.140066  ORF Transcript_59965/g.140066 Transcript_59965/m.140066 type:complete len:244 (-) Transcript_59965:936-1667(-)
MAATLEAHPGLFFSGFLQTLPPAPIHLHRGPPAPAEMAPGLLASKEVGTLRCWSTEHLSQDPCSNLQQARHLLRIPRKGLRPQGSKVTSAHPSPGLPRRCWPPKRPRRHHCLRRGTQACPHRSPGCQCCVPWPPRRPGRAPALSWRPAGPLSFAAPPATLPSQGRGHLPCHHVPLGCLDCGRWCPCLTHRQLSTRLHQSEDAKLAIPKATNLGIRVTLEESAAETKALVEGLVREETACAEAV